MANFNSVVLLGRLTRDPELRYTAPEGVPVCVFSLAVSVRRKGADGTPREEASFFDVEVWRKPAEISAEFLRKGKQVLVAGELRQERWKDEKTGKPRNRVKIVADQVQFLSPKGEGSEAPAPDAIVPDPADVEA